MMRTDLFLNMLQIKHQAEQPPRRLRACAGVVAAGLGTEAITPQRHFARAVTANFLAPIDGSINLPKRKSAAVLLRQLGEIRRPHGQEFTHDASASVVDAMANRAIILIFKLAAGDDFDLLSGHCPGM